MTEIERWIDELRSYETEMRNRAKWVADKGAVTDKLREIWTFAADELRALRKTLKR